MKTLFLSEKASTAFMNLFTGPINLPVMTHWLLKSPGTNDQKKDFNIGWDLSYLSVSIGTNAWFDHIPFGHELLKG